MNHDHHQGEQAKRIQEPSNGQSLSLDQRVAKDERLPGSTAELDPATASSAWFLAFTAVEKENPASAEALRLCSLLAAKGIPLDLFREAHAHLGGQVADALSAVEEEPIRLHDLLRPLRDHSLITLDGDSLSWGHRLAAVVALDGLSEAELKTLFERLVAAFNILLPEPELANLPRWQRFLPHAMRLAKLAAEWQFDSLPLASLLNDLAELLQDSGCYTEAEPLYRQALAIRETVLGPEHCDVAGGLNNLAMLLRATGRYAQAEPVYRRALAIYEAALGAQHPDVAASLNNLAVLLRATGRYAEAEPLYRRALAISETALRPEHPQTAAILDNLAGLLDATGRYAEAEPLHRRALAIFQATLGPEHPDTRRTLMNLLMSPRAGPSGEAE